MNTDYQDGRRERLSGLSDEQLAEQLQRKAQDVSQIERMIVRREDIRTPEDGAPAFGNRHQRRRAAREARRSQR